MAYNLFGNPITNETLEAMSEYEGKTLTLRDRAHVALRMKNAEDKDKNAREYVEKLKRDRGTGISTLCLLYNATGDTINYVCEYDWHGHIGPAPYPTAIANGQWGALLHVQTNGAFTGSAAAVVYRGLNDNGVRCDWMAAWSNPFNRIIWDNSAYTEIREEGHYTAHDNWNYIFNLLEKSSHSASDKWNKCVSNVITGDDTNPIFEAIFTISES